MNDEAEQLMQMLDETVPRPTHSQSPRFSAAVALAALAALPFASPFGSGTGGRRVGGGSALVAEVKREVKRLMDAIAAKEAENAAMRSLWQAMLDGPPEMIHVSVADAVYMTTHEIARAALPLPADQASTVSKSVEKRVAIIKASEAKENDHA